MCVNYIERDRQTDMLGLLTKVARLLPGRFPCGCLSYSVPLPAARGNPKNQTRAQHHGPCTPLPPRLHLTPPSTPQKPHRLPSVPPAQQTPSHCRAFAHAVKHTVSLCTAVRSMSSCSLPLRSIPALLEPLKAPRRHLWGFCYLYHNNMYLNYS